MSLLLKYVVIYVNKRALKVYCIEDIDHFITLSLLVVEVFDFQRRRGSLRSQRRRKKSKVKKRNVIFIFIWFSICTAKCFTK